MPLVVTDQAHYVTAEDDYYFGCDLTDYEYLQKIPIVDRSISQGFCESPSVATRTAS